MTESRRPGSRGVAWVRELPMTPCTWTTPKMIVILATLCAVISVVAPQTSPAPTTPPVQAARPSNENQTAEPAAAATGPPPTSLPPTNASYVDTSDVNATIESVTVASTSSSDNASTAPNTTAKMEEITYIARMPVSQAPSSSPYSPTDPLDQTPSEMPLDEPDNQLLNSTVFDLLVRQAADMQGMNYSDPREQCTLRELLEPAFFDFEADDGGTFCPSFFDEIQCWKANPPGEVVRQCPESFRGIEYNTNDTVTRLCHFNGSWGNDNKSDYSQCEAIISNRPFDPHSRAVDMIIYTGYILSFTALMGAFFILIYFKSLRCVRNYIHLNLVASFLLLYIIFFLIIIISTASTAADQPWYCRMQGTAVVYLNLTNFFWMFVEGLYLHTMVVRALTVRREKFWVYCVIGWGLPVVFAVAHAITMTVTASNEPLDADCLSKNEADYIVRVPIMAVILVNVCFMVHIIVILVTKLRASHSFETQQYRKGVRGIIVLLPLLGAAYFMLLLEPNPKEPNVSTYVYRYVNAVLQSTQGLFVAIIYVYMNQEVQSVIKRRFRRWREENTLPSRINSRKGSHQYRNSFANNFSNFRKSGDDTVKTSVKSVKSVGKTDHHVGNGKVQAYEKQEELVPLQPVPENNVGVDPDADVSGVPDWSPNDHESPPETCKLTTSSTSSCEDALQCPKVANHEDDNDEEDDFAVDEACHQNGETFVLDDIAPGLDQDITIGVGSDEALIVQGNTPVMEQNLFLQDKLTRDNNNVHQRNGLKVNGSDENLLAGQVSVLNASSDLLSNATDVQQRNALLPESSGDSNENNSNNTQLPRILKTARERPHGSAPKKHVAFVCPETGADYSLPPQQQEQQQFLVDLDFDSSNPKSQSHGLSKHPDCTCSTIASDPWAKEGDRSKWSPKILFKRPRAHGSPASQRLVPSSGEEGRNGRIKLPKSPAGTPV